MTTTLNQKQTLLKRIDSKHQVKRTKQVPDRNVKLYASFTVLMHTDKAQSD